MNKTTTRPFLLRFSIREQIVFNKRLALIMRSGTPLLAALHMLDTGDNSRSISYVLSRIIADVSRGSTLSAALSEYARFYGMFTINMVRVGEASGTLHENLLYISHELKKKDDLKKKIRGALIYPSVIICATIGISSILTIYIFPKIMPIFASFKQQLPVSTRILIVISQFLIAHGVAVLFLCVVLGIALFFLSRRAHVSAFLDRILLMLPIIGTLSTYYNVANCMRTMSLLLRGDMRIVTALQIVSASSNNALYREALKQVASSVMKGKKLSAELAQHAKLFPAIVIQMISVGEETGDLSESCMYISDMCEEEINDLTRTLTVLLEPILMIVMGVVVGFIAISIITPIYGITQNLTPH